MPDSPDLIQSMLRELLAKVDTLHGQMTGIEVAHATLRGDMASKILEQSSTLDNKIILLERRIEEKMQARAEKVDKWFDDMGEAFNQYKLTMESKMTSITVKVGIVFSVVTAILVAITTAIMKWILSAPAIQ